MVVGQVQELVAVSKPYELLQLAMFYGGVVSLFYCERCGAVVGDTNKHELNVHANLPATNVADVLVKVDEVLEAWSALSGRLRTAGVQFVVDSPIDDLSALLAELRTLRTKESRP